MSVERARSQTGRLLTVAALLLLSLYIWAPDLVRLTGHPLAELGVSVDANAVVQAVDARAAGSGIRAGDRFDLARATPDQHFTYVTLRGINNPPLDRARAYPVPMLRNGRAYTAVLHAYREDRNNEWAVLLRAAVQALSMALGTLVLLRRPSIATWAFFIMMFVGCAGANVSMFWGPPVWRDIVFSAYWLLGWNAPGAWAGLIFAVYLRHDGPLPRWRRVILAVAITSGVANCAAALGEANTMLFAARTYPLLAYAYTILVLIPYLAAPAVLVATYFESSSNVRERLRWIIGGFVLAAVCIAIDQSSSQGTLALFQASYVTHSLLDAGYFAFITIPVAYAVLKHHIIDVNVAISRATVYTLLSVLIVGAFALVDLFFTKALEQKSAGLIADIGLALILGFSFNTMHRRVDDFVDRFVFRKRHVALEHVRRLGDAMMYAQRESLVTSLLIEDAVRALDLSGAELIDKLPEAADEVQSLASQLSAGRGALRRSETLSSLRSNAGFTPAVAVPVFSHGAVSAVVLYGVHANGTDLDAEEVTLLERLGVSAGAALDRLEADELRTEAHDLRIENTALHRAFERLGPAAGASGRVVRNPEQ